MNNLPPPTPGEGERGGEAVKPNQFLKLTAMPPGLPLCLVFHVLIPPSPFSAVAKKGVTIELHYKTFPLFARAERGTQGGEYV